MTRKIKFHNSHRTFHTFLMGACTIIMSSCGTGPQEQTSQLLSDESTRVNDIYYWEYKKSLGQKEQASVDLDSLIKNTGNGINRKTTARFALDLHLFNHRIAKPSQADESGQIVDIGSHLNEGRLSSYSYVRILGDTKYKWETRTPSFDQEFTRVYDVGVKVPIASATGVSMNADTKVSGSIGAKLLMDSPKPYELEGRFMPTVQLSAIAGISANGPFWSQASVHGTYTLVNYQFNGAIHVAYQPDLKKLSSSIQVNDHAIEALKGDLKIAASFGPTASESGLLKELWTLATKTSEGPRYEKNLLHLDGLKFDLDTFERTRSFYLAEPESFEECVIRAETLVQETKEMVTAIERSSDNNSSLTNEANDSLEDAFSLIDECKAMLENES